MFMPHKHLIVFDCDGTLIDSGHNIVTAMRKAWLSNGLKPPPTNAIRRIVGLKLGEAIYQLMPPECDIEPAILEESYIKSFTESLNRSDYTEPLYPGVRQCLESLKALGFQLGIATGKSRRGLLRTFEQHSLGFFFQVLKTADDGPGKPSPDILLDAMAEIGVEPENTAMIGDTTYDIKMAMNAAVKPIGVDWGYHDPIELKKAGARIIIKNCSSLPDILREIWDSD